MNAAADLIQIGARPLDFALTCLEKTIDMRLQEPASWVHVTCSNSDKANFARLHMPAQSSDVNT
ncbi:MAG TPA: hypothetical protein VIL30_15675, partial [Ramlibacter sp.]